MNQILNEFEQTPYADKSYVNSSNHRTILFRNIFIISIFIIIACILYFMHQLSIEKKNQEIADHMLNHFNITTLYSSSSEYQTDLTATKDPFVIGMIEIPAINVHYPILSTISDENLKIAPCRFYGPTPNNIGNLCIAAHNYKNDKFFSKLNQLQINDMIVIYDSNGHKVSYLIYDKYVTDYSSIECTSQNTNGEKEVTLVTCNKPDNTKRIIVKAKEKK